VASEWASKESDMAATPLPGTPGAIDATAGLDTVRMSHYQRLRARARMAQAELVADLLVRTWRAIAR
jgi:hypothetical protein